MKSFLTLLAASVLLVFTLSACGGGDKQTGANDQDHNNGTNSDNVTGGQDGGIIGDRPSNASGTQGGTDGTMPEGNGGTNRDDGRTDGSGLMEDAKDALDDVGDALTGDGHTVRQSVRSTYDQMLRNAHVHDKDGDLTDRENSTTPGSTF